MPTSLVLNGLNVYRPGVYGEIDVSSLGGSVLSAGNVAIVGDFRQFLADTPVTFTSPAAVKDFDALGTKLGLAAKLAFNPSLDDAVPAGAGTLTLVNVTPTAKATGTAKDLSAADSLDFLSVLAGKRSNRAKFKIETTADGAQTVKITLTREGLSEIYTDVGSPALGTLYYSGSDAAATTLTLTTSALTWDWRVDQTFTAPGGSQTQALNVSDLAADGQIAVNYSIGASGNVTSDIVVTVVGVNKDGDATTGVATIPTGAPPGADVAVASGGNPVEWASITSITSTTDDTAFNGLVDVNGYAFQLTLSEWETLADVLSYIDGYDGYEASASSPQASGTPATELDGISAANVLGAGNTQTVYAHTYAVVQALAGSRIMTASRHSGSNAPPAQFGANPATSQEAYLAGGTETPGSKDYASALQQIETADVQIVVLDSTTYADHAALVQHCKNAAVAGSERNGYVAAPSTSSLADLLANYTGLLNSRHVGLCAQKPTVVNTKGALEEVDEWYLAVMLAGMQAGTDISTPLTRKRPAVTATSQSWVPNRDAATAIKHGVIQLSSDSLGYYVERSVTTYLSDDNPVYSEVSTNESVNTSIRDLRSMLNSEIGTAVVGTTAKQLTGRVEDRLEQQVRAGVLKAVRNVVLTTLGDTIRVDYEAAPVEPLNFVLIGVSAQRF